MSRVDRAKAIILGLLLLLQSTLAGADEPQDIEAHVRRLANGLRCLVCQNQTLADSHAELAMDLKKQMREMIRQGASDKEIIDFMVQRYGDFVLYRPPFKNTTFLLWFGPLLIGLLALTVLFLVLRRKNKLSPPVSLTDEDAQKVARLLEGEDKS